MTNHRTTTALLYALVVALLVTSGWLAVAELRVMEYKGEAPGPIDIVTPRQPERDGARSLLLAVPHLLPRGGDRPTGTS